MKITSAATAVLSMALLALAAGEAMAQPDDGDRQRRGRRGPGMRGGFIGGGNQLLGLLRIEEVRQELEMQPAQQEALTKITQDAREQMRPDSDFNFREASKEQRREMFQQMRERQQEIAGKVETQLQEVLLPAQWERLQQISLQTQGVRALGNPDVASKLNITDQQQQEMREVQENLRETMRDRAREAMQSGNREQMRTIFSEIRQQSEEQVLGVLSEQQRAEFQEMQGEPFEMPTFAGRAGAGGRDGFRGRGRRNGSGGRGGRRDDDGGRRDGRRGGDRDGGGQ